MKEKVPQPVSMVYIRHQDDPSDEVAQVTEESYDNYFAERGWVVVPESEVNPPEPVPYDTDQGTYVPPQTEPDLVPEQEVDPVDPEGDDS
jgi:hypothetical protein